MSKRFKIGVIFGGRSGEHEVSLVSAASVMKALDKKKYQIIPIGIAKNGQWLALGDPLRALKENNLKLTKLATPIINPKNKTFIRVGGREIKADIIFPVLHGTYGEDGTIQGLFEMANIPYVGAGVLGSALGMDKVAQKQLYQNAGLPIVNFFSFLKNEWQGNLKTKKLKNLRTNIVRHIEKKLKYPIFVKPANLGSSVGISKAHNRKELIQAINLAIRFDRKILIEEGVKNAREIECSVMGNENPQASVLGEIIPSNEFYDYDAKYVDGKSQAIVPAKLPPKTIQTIQKLALKAYKTLDLAGMARIDFLVGKGSNRIFINEPNTIPGFTSISMYPKLWEASGLLYSKLLDELIKLAMERHREKNKLQLSFGLKKKWYRR